MSTERERRREPRLESVDFISVKELHAEELRRAVTLGQTADLSHDGLRVELGHPLPLGSVVALTLSVGDELVDLEARVCSLKWIDEHTCSIGLGFTRVPPATRQAIDAHLSRLRATTAGAASGGDR